MIFSLKYLIILNSYPFYIECFAGAEVPSSQLFVYISSQVSSLLKFCTFEPKLSGYFKEKIESEFELGIRKFNIFAT